MTELQIPEDIKNQFTRVCELSLRSASVTHWIRASLQLSDSGPDEPREHWALPDIWFGIGYRKMSQADLARSMPDVIRLMYGVSSVPPRTKHSFIRTWTYVLSENAFYYDATKNPASDAERTIAFRILKAII